jgi:hypothetical protein
VVYFVRNRRNEANDSMTYIPMRLLRIPEPFDHLEFVYEPKIDGFRALAIVRGHRSELVSRNGHVFTSIPSEFGPPVHRRWTRMDRHVYPKRTRADQAYCVFMRWSLQL